MELLRLILMCLIIAHHGIVHGLSLTGLQFSTIYLQEQDLLPACLLNSLFIIAVNTFILISGYYSIKVSSSKYIRLICQLFVCTILFSSLYYLIKREYVNTYFSLLIFSHSRYWFMVCYLILMAFAPAINLFYKSFLKEAQRMFVLALLCVSCYLGFLWHFESNINGYTVFQFITLYSVGMYLRDNDIHIKALPAAVIYLSCSIVLTIAMLFFHKTGHDSWAWIMTYYNNPVLIVSAIAFFFVFKNLKIQNQRINWLASSSLFIYLFSSSALIEHFYYSFIRSIYESHGRIVFVLLPVIALFISVVAIILDKLLVSRTVNYLTQKLMGIKFSWLHI